MRRFGVILAAIACAVALSGGARAAGLDSVTTRQLNALNPVSLERYLENLGRAYPAAPAVSLRRVVSDLAHRRNPLALQALGRALLDAVGGDLVQEGRVLGLLLILTVAGAVLARLGEAFSGHGVAEVASMVVLAALIGVAVSSFRLAVSGVAGMIGQIVHLMEASIPAVLVLMAGSGALASAGMMHPLLIMTVNLVALAAKGFVLPLVLLAVMVEVVAAWMPRYRLAQLASLLKQVAIFSLGGLLSLFLAVCAMANVAG